MKNVLELFLKHKILVNCYCTAEEAEEFDSIMKACSNRCGSLAAETTLRGRNYYLHFREGKGLSYSTRPVDGNDNPMDFMLMQDFLRYVGKSNINISSEDFDNVFKENEND